MNFINDLGIKNGLEFAAEYNKEHKFIKEIGKRFLIAKCNLEGDSSEIEYLFEIEKCFKAKGEIDLNSIDELVRVEENQELAKANSGSVASTGNDIFGNIIEGSGFVNLNDKLGENVCFSDKDGMVISEKDGYVCITDDGKLNVKNEKPNNAI